MTKTPRPPKTLKLKPVFLSANRMRQLRELAKSQNTSPAKLVDDLVAKAIWEGFVQELDVEGSPPSDIRDLAGMHEIMTAADWRKAAMVFCPSDWGISIGHAGSELVVEFKFIDKVDTTHSFSLTLENAEKFSAIIEEVSMENSADDVRTVEGEFIVLRKVGPAVRLAIVSDNQTGNVELGYATLAETPAGEFCGSIDAAVRWAKAAEKGK